MSKAFAASGGWGLPAFLTMVAGVFAGCGPGAPPDAQPEIWRFAIEESEGSVQHEYALRFKRRIEAGTGGAVRVLVYPYGTLGTSTQMTEQLSMGVVELAMASPGSLGKFIPELQVFLLHFVLPADDHLHRQVLSDPGMIAWLDDLYAPKGLKLLSVYSEGEMVWTTNRSVRQPEDFRGIKMRVMTSPLLLASYNQYGASATPMPYSEVYSALQLNMIDGQVNPVFAIERQKFFEVTSWMIFPGHASFITTCAANRRFYERLSPQRRQLISRTVRALDGEIFAVQRRLQTERLKTILEAKLRQKSELHLIADLSAFRRTLSGEEQRRLLDDNPYLHLHPPLTEDEREAFRKAALPVRDVYLRIGGARSAEVLDFLTTAVARRRAAPPAADAASRLNAKEQR